MRPVALKRAPKWRGHFCPRLWFWQLPVVDITWKSCGFNGLTVFSSTRYGLKVSRTDGFELVSDLFWTEGAPLRGKAVRSLTIRLNVPVVR